MSLEPFRLIAPIETRRPERGAGGLDEVDLHRPTCPGRRKRETKEKPHCRKPRRTQVPVLPEPPKERDACQRPGASERLIWTHRNVNSLQIR